MLTVQISLATFSWYHVLIAEPEDRGSKPEGPWCNLRQCEYHVQWRIQDFPGEGAPTPAGGSQHTILPYFPKNCMQLKEFGPPGGGGTRPSRPPLRSATDVHGNKSFEFLLFCIGLVYLVELGQFN